MKILPARPNLDFLLREAKVIKSRHRKADKTVCSLIGHYDTSLHGLTNEQIFNTPFSILDAQRVVARQYSFTSWARMKKYVDLSRLGEKPTDPSLRKYLLERRKQIQSLQEDIKNKKVKYNEYITFTNNSTALLSSAYETHGWPGPDAIGLDCMESAWYVAASAVCGYIDSAGDFQLFIPDIYDPKNIDKRRATVGHIALDAYRKTFAQEAKENNWEYGTRTEAAKELERVSKEGGYT